MQLTLGAYSLTFGRVLTTFHVAGGSTRSDVVAADAARAAQAPARPPPAARGAMATEGRA
jgi:hypothetical protein